MPSEASKARSIGQDHRALVTESIESHSAERFRLRDQSLGVLTIEPHQVSERQVLNRAFVFGRTMAKLSLCSTALSNFVTR